ncbi:MAG: hypothetical protein ACK5T6_04425 [Pirellula sp.]
MKRQYNWLAIIPVIAAGGVWAYAQEPNATQPPRNDIGRFGPERGPALSPNSSGETAPRVIVEERVDPITGNVQRYTKAVGVPVQQMAQGFPLQGPAQAYSPGFPNPPMVPGTPALAPFPGQPGPKPELLELEDGKFKIFTKENPTPEDWQTDAKAKQMLAVAMQKLKSTDVDEKELEEARNLLSNYLEVQFDHDITKREQQIGDLQKQIEKLKSQLDKRKTSKEKMIEMRLTLMENETNGLGFPPAWNALPSASGGPANYFVPTPNFTQPQQPGYYRAPGLPDPNYGGAPIPYTDPNPPQRDNPPAKAIGTLPLYEPSR